MVAIQGIETPRHLQKTVLTPPKKRIPDEILELAKKSSTAAIVEQLLRMSFRFVHMLGVNTLSPGLVMAGRAYTLRYLPRREDHSQMGPERYKYAQHVAIETVGPGDVLVVDARGNTKAGIFGDLLISRMKYRGAEGLVTDGAFRDISFIKSINYPVFCGGAHSYYHSPEHWAMDTQLPIACGNVTVYPGDLIVGDDDGVIMVPQAIAEEAVIKAVDDTEHEEFIRYLIENGASINDVHPLKPEQEAKYEGWRKSREK